MNEQELNECLWQEIVLRAGKQFETYRGVPFTYHIKEDRSGETSGTLVIDRKAVSITRSTALLAYHRAVEVQASRKCVSKPGKIGVYGDTWLYPVFLDIGICTKTPQETAGTLGSGIYESRHDPIQAPYPEKVCKNCGYTTGEDFEYCPKCGNKFC